MPKVNKLTTPEKDAIKNKSPLTMPTNPTKSGWSDSQIKQRLSQFVTDEEDSVLAVLDEKLEEIDDAFTDTDGDVSAVEARVTTAEGDIDQLEIDVLALDNVKADITYVDAHKNNTSNPHAVTKAQVGLGNADNTSDLNKPISTATQSALDLKAPLTSPALTGTPTAPTAAPGNNTTQVSTTAFVTQAVSTLQSYTDSELSTKADLVGGKLDLNQLPMEALDSLKYYTSVSGQVNTLALRQALAAELADVYYLNSGKVIGNYFIINSSGTISGVTGIQVVSGDYVGTYITLQFRNQDSGAINATVDNSGALESGDWFVLEQVSGSGTSGSPFVFVVSVISNNYEDATSAIKGIVQLSSSTSTLTTGNNVITDGVLKDLIGDTSTKIGRGDYAKAGYDHSLLTNNPHSVTKSQVGLSNVDNVQQIPLSQKGAIGGVASLDTNGHVFYTQLPAKVVDDVVYLLNATVYENAATLPINTTPGRISIFRKNALNSGLELLTSTTTAAPFGFDGSLNSGSGGNTLAPTQMFYLVYNDVSAIYRYNGGLTITPVLETVNVAYLDMGTLTTTGPHTITFTATNPAKAVNFINVKLDSGSFDATIIIPSSLYDKKVIFTFENIQPASSGRTLITIKTAHASARLYKVDVNAGDTLKYEYLPKDEIITSPINIDYGNVVFPELQFVRNQYLVSTTPLHPSFINLISQPSSSKIRVQLWLYKPTFKEKPGFYQNQYAKRGDFWAHPADNCIGNSVTLPGQSAVSFAGGAAPLHLLDLHTRPIKAGWGVGSYNYRKSVATYYGTSWDLTYDVNGFAATNMPYGGFVRTEFAVTADNIIGGQGPMSRLQINMAPFMGSYASNTAWVKSFVGTTHGIYTVPRTANLFIPANSGGSNPKGDDFPMAVHRKEVRFAYNTLVSLGAGLGFARMTNGAKSNGAGTFTRSENAVTPISLRKTNVVFKFVYTLNGEILKFAPNFTGSITINNSMQPATTHEGTSPNKYYPLNFIFSFKNSRYDTRMVKQD